MAFPKFALYRIIPVTAIICFHRIFSIILMVCFGYCFTNTSPSKTESPFQPPRLLRTFPDTDKWKAKKNMINLVRTASTSQCGNFGISLFDKKFREISFFTKRKSIGVHVCTCTFIVRNIVTVSESFFCHTVKILVVPTLSTIHTMRA